MQIGHWMSGRCQWIASQASGQPEEMLLSLHLRSADGALSLQAHRFVSLIIFLKKIIINSKLLNFIYI